MSWFLIRGNHMYLKLCHRQNKYNVLVRNHAYAMYMYIYIECRKEVSKYRELSI